MGTETYSRTPRLNTWRELGDGDVAPKKAEPLLAGETRMFCGTLLRTTLPLTMRQPSLMIGVALIVILVETKLQLVLCLLKKTGTSFCPREVIRPILKTNKVCLGQLGNERMRTDFDGKKTMC